MMIPDLFEDVSTLLVFADVIGRYRCHFGNELRL